MSAIQEMSCWEIMQCGAEECVARRHPETPCWEVVKELDYFQSAFNICSDCIVFVSKQQPSVLTDQELMLIMERKREEGHKCPAAHGFCA